MTRCLSCLRKLVPLDGDWRLTLNRRLYARPCDDEEARPDVCADCDDRELMTVPMPSNRVLDPARASR